MRLFFNDGSGGFADTQDIVVADMLGPSSVIDLDCDGEVDIVVPSLRDGALYMLPGEGGGSFGAPVTVTDGYEIPLGTVVKDIDADSAPDVVVLDAKSGVARAHPPKNETT